MVPRVAFTLCLAVVTASAGVDFTPEQQILEFEGRTVSVPAFRIGAGGKLIYNPPAGWTVTGAGRRLQLSPKPSYSEALIEARPLPAGGSLDESALELIKREMLVWLPKEAENIRWEPAEVNPILFNQHETRRLTVAYSAFAQRLKLTVLVCNFAEEQIRFRLAARDNDFDKLYDALRRSLYTWQGMR
jgi:hypothetical protein